MTHNSEDVRVLAIGKIWGFATVMLVICIPLGFVTGGSVIALAAIAGATIATVVIWQSPEREDDGLTDSIKNLERRIADLETICTQEVNVSRRIRRWDTED